MDASSFPFISVVVPAYKAAGSIGDCLSSILADDYPRDRREIIVVGRHADEPTLAAVARYPVACVVTAKTGAAAARNAGYRASKGVFTAFVDADCTVTRGWLRRLVAGFSDPAVGVVVGENCALLPHSPLERYSASIRQYSPERLLGNAAMPFIPTLNVAFRRELVERVGLFDDALPTNEGADLALRLLDIPGAAIGRAPRAVVFYRTRASFGAFLRQNWHYGYGYALLCIKHRERIRWGLRNAAWAHWQIIRNVALLAPSLVRYKLGQGDDLDFYFHFFEATRRLAQRLGFWHGAWSHGHLYL